MERSFRNRCFLPTIIRVSQTSDQSSEMSDMLRHRLGSSDTTPLAVNEKLPLNGNNRSDNDEDDMSEGADESELDDSASFPKSSKLSGVKSRRARNGINYNSSDPDDENSGSWDARLEKLVHEIPQDSQNATHQLLDARLASFSPRWRNWLIRCLFSLLMIAGCTLIIRLGPLALIALTSVIHIRCFQEIIAIGHAVYRTRALPWFRTLSWYFLVVSSYFFYGVSAIEAMGTYLQKDNFLAPLIKYHHFISFCLYIVGFVMFVLSLRRGYYFRQFSLFAWTHTALLILDVATYSYISSLFQGIIWWVMPVAMVITNDIMAYLFGFFFGRTPLIKVSPKKTWEGFIGGAFGTVAIGLLMSYALMHHQYFICPVEFDEQTRLFVMQCDPPPPSFRLDTYRIGDFRLTCYPFLLHSIVLSTFSSVIGPFAGFFASGFKRSCKVKDFGAVIPGHGGLTDRFDCQTLMAIFVHVYIRTFIRPSSPYKIMHQVHAMDVDDQVTVWNSLGKSLWDRGLINSTGYPVVLT